MLALEATICGKGSFRGALKSGGVALAVMKSTEINASDFRWRRSKFQGLGKYMSITAEMAVGVAEKYALENFSVRGIEFGRLDGSTAFAEALLSDCDVDVADYKDNFWVFVCETEVEEHMRPEYLSEELINLVRIILVDQKSLEVLYDDDHIVEEFDWSGLEREASEGLTTFDVDAYAESLVIDQLVFECFEVVETIEGRDDISLGNILERSVREALVSKNSWLVVSRANCAPVRTSSWSHDVERVRVIGVSKSNGEISLDRTGYLFPS